MSISISDWHRYWRNLKASRTRKPVTSTKGTEWVEHDIGDGLKFYTVKLINRDIDYDSLCDPVANITALLNYYRKPNYFYYCEADARATQYYVDNYDN